MAIDTNTEKLSLMEWGNIWEPALPLSPGTLGQDDKQQLLWGYPGITWGPPGVSPDYVFMADGTFVATTMDSESFTVTEMDTEAFDNG